MIQMEETINACGIFVGIFLKRGPDEKQRLRWNTVSRGFHIDFLNES
jgi:hypothetical protein